MSCKGQTTACKCGALPSEAILYESMPSDTSFPEPGVIDISHVAGSTKIQIKYTSADSGLTENYILLETSDEGRHWEKSSLKTSDPMQVTHLGTIIYRYDEKGIFERSTDNGDHWERPEFRINGIASQIGNSEPVDRPASLSFSFSGANPQKPTSIYGCFKPTATSHPEQGGRGPTLPAGLMSPSTLETIGRHLRKKCKATDQGRAVHLESVRRILILCDH